mgnify:CR=1 FL=1
MPSLYLAYEELTLACSLTYLIISSFLMLYLAYEELTLIFCIIFNFNIKLYLAYEELTLVKSSPDLSRAFTVVPCLLGIDTMIFLSIKVSLISHCCTLPMRN